ncbi:MAG TPA: hypothetical protein PK829_10065 [Promineifilum sp.]|nr:hypothetical protein [Promineifilum sp.]
MTPDEELTTMLTDFFGLPGGQWPARALLQVDRAAGSVVVVQPQPCDCLPAAGATLFPADAADCANAARADAEVFRYDYLAQDPARLDGLSAADLNNIACTLLWQSDASPESARAAHDLLTRARARCADGDPLRDLIDRNLDKFRPVAPGVPRPLAMLQSVVYDSGRAMGSLEEWTIEKEG